MRIARREFIVLLNAGLLTPMLAMQALPDFDDGEDDDPGGGDDDEGDDGDDAGDDDNGDWNEHNAADDDNLGLNDRAPNLAGSELSQAQAAAVEEDKEARTSPPANPNEYYSDEPLRDFLSNASTFMDTVINTLKEDVADFVNQLDEMTYPARSLFGPGSDDSVVAHETSYAVGPSFGSVDFQVDNQGGKYITAVVAEVPVEIGVVPAEVGAYITTGVTGDGRPYLADGSYIGYQEIGVTGYFQTEAGRDLNFQLGVTLGREDFSVDVDVRDTIDRIGSAYDRMSEEFGRALSNIQQNMIDDSLRWRDY
jgi:hypothetical protein